MSEPVSLTPKWYTVAQVAQLLGYGETKVRMLIIAGELRSLKDGRAPGASCRSGSTSTSRGGRRRRRRLVAAMSAPAQRGGLDLPVPERLRRLRLGHHAGRRRQRKYVYGKTREIVHAKWIELRAAGGPGSGRGQGADGGPVPVALAERDRRPESGPADLRDLRESCAPLPRSRARVEPARPAPGGRRSAWLNRLPTQCQCCAQGKDARRSERGKARCCAVGKCCQALPSARTIKDVRAVLRSALSNAMREEFIARNVAELVTAPKQRKRKVVPWSSEEARRFLESARGGRDAMYAAYVLILVLGLRKGEVLGLRWEAVDLEGRELIIDHQVQRVRRELLTGRPRRMPQTPLCRCRRLWRRRW